MYAACPVLPLIHLHHGISTRSTLPVYHGDFRILPGACFLSSPSILGPLSVSLVCSASANNHRQRNLDITRQRGSMRGKNKSYQERDESENVDEFDSDGMSSKIGPPISLASNSRPQVVSTPGDREKEIVELFKRVQAQLRAKGKGREDKNPELAKAQGERGSVDSLLNLLRKHSVDQKRESIDEKEHTFDQTRRINGYGNKHDTRTFGIKNDTKEEQKPRPAFFKRPVSNFRRRSPVPGVKFQSITNSSTNADAKSITNSIADAVLKAKIPLDEQAVTNEPDPVSLYEPNSVISSEDTSLDDFGVISDDDESDASDTDECNEEYPETPLIIVDVTDINASYDRSLEYSSAEGSDRSSLKVTELRELAKSRGIKGYSKMKKNELIEALNN